MHRIRSLARALRSTMILNPNRLLRRFGLELRRLKRAPRFPPPPEQELSELESILGAFAQSRPTDSVCADRDALRQYLSNRRIMLFNDLLQRCATHGVSFDGRRVADVGTGMGYLLRLIAQRAANAQLFGFDTFAEMNELVNLMCADATVETKNLFQIEDRFDIVICTETLEHLVRPVDALHALLARVDVNGQLILTVPDGRVDQQEAGERRTDGSAFWGHIHFWSPESWALLLAEELGSQTEIITGQLATGENYAILTRHRDDGRSTTRPVQAESPATGAAGVRDKTGQ